jgi:GDP-L-fucose synthase
VAWLPDPRSFHAKRVLVTGGHGFIGRHVVTALAEVGARPISTIHPLGIAVPDLPAETVTVNLEDPEQTAEVVGGADVVIHLAARAGGIQFQREGDPDVFATNRLMTDNLLAASADSRVQRFFLASSLVTYRPVDERLTEDHPQLGPTDGPDPYASSKILDEAAAFKQRGLDTVVGRFGNVYGPGAPFEPDRSTVVHALIDRAVRLDAGEDLVVWGDGDAIRSFVFVEDAARAVLTIVARGIPGEAYNIDSGEEITIAHLASVVREQVDSSLTLDFDPSWPSGERHRVASIDKLMSLGFIPVVGLDEGIRRTVAWHRENAK